METVARCREEIEKLLAKIKKIEDNPKNQNPKGTSLHRHTVSAQRRIDKLRWEVAHWMSEIRTLQGNPVPCNGYSGRKSNRR